MGKKTPLTLQHFAPVLAWLDQRGAEPVANDHCWTLDFAARRQTARDEAASHRREAERQREQGAALRVLARGQRKADQALEVDQSLAKAGDAERAARDASAKAQAIDDAVFDLKAVNPREKKVVDSRTPAQLLVDIARKGQEVDAALATLQGLLGQA